jgi:hypothetical protein
MTLPPDNHNPHPSQLPPPGWYPDPAGAGFRWWDGGRWTDQAGGEQQTPTGSQPPPSATGADDGPSPNRRARGWSGRSKAIGLAVAIVLLVGGALVLSSGSGGDTYAECQREVQPTLTAMQGLGSHLDVGLVQADYAAEVGDVQATYDRLDAKHSPTACQPVLMALGEAMDAYARASSEWNECILAKKKGAQKKPCRNSGRTPTTR